MIRGYPLACVFNSWLANIFREKAEQYNVFNRPPLQQSKKKVTTVLSPRRPVSSTSKSSNQSVPSVTTTSASSNGTGEVDASRLGKASKMAAMWEEKSAIRIVTFVLTDWTGSEVDPLSLPPKPKRKMSLAEDSNPSLSSVAANPIPAQVQQHKQVQIIFCLFVLSHS